MDVRGRTVAARAIGFGVGSFAFTTAALAQSVGAAGAPSTTALLALALLGLVPFAFMTMTS
ncbi:MAG: hypothetical protein H5U40_17565, partial [Polyangiaceae bacterium]|nr:hypothetical protein [Polyangiaceae bacterium]